MKRQVGVLFLIVFLAFSLRAYAADASPESRNQKAVISKTSPKVSDTGPQKEIKQKTRKLKPGMPVDPLEKQVKQAKTPCSKKADMPVEPLEKDAGSVR